MNYSFLLSILIDLIKIIIIIIPILISIAYLTLAERKILGYMQTRKGPNVVGIYGLLQPLADGVKLFTKEALIPKSCQLISILCCPHLSVNLGLFSLRINSFRNWFGIEWSINRSIVYFCHIIDRSLCYLNVRMRK